MLKIPVTVLAVVEIIMGVLTIIAWLEHIKGIKAEAWAPEGWAKYIKSIIWPDMLMIVTLFVSGCLLLTGNPMGLKLSLAAGGMLLYLCLLVGSYNIQNRLYPSNKGGFSFILADTIVGVVGVFVTYGGLTTTMG